jgi:Na+/H+ antiporter NhaA
MTPPSPSREALVHQLYEAAELEHNLMCTYLYAAFSLKTGVDEGLSAVEAEATARWRRTMLQVAVEEMGHLTAVWNITAALGGIGFTMSLFIAGQAFPVMDDFAAAKIAVFAASVLSAIIGVAVLWGAPSPGTEKASA